MLLQYYKYSVYIDIRLTVYNRYVTCIYNVITNVLHYHTSINMSNTMWLLINFIVLFQGRRGIVHTRRIVRGNINRKHVTCNTYRYKLICIHQLTVISIMYYMCKTSTLSKSDSYYIVPYNLCADCHTFNIPRKGVPLGNNLRSAGM